VGRLSAALKTELLKQAPEVSILLKITVAGTVHRFSDAGGTFIADGAYHDEVLSWGGGPARGVTQKTNSLEITNWEVTLNDTEQEITKLLEGPLRHFVRGATAVVYLSSRNVASADWLTLNSGRVDTYGQSSLAAWTFQLSPNDLPLQRESIPKGKIRASDWPASALTVRDLPSPIIYGRISSANGTNDGAVPCHYVDSGGFRYLVAAGWLKSVDTVYKDGTPVPAADYAITHPVVNGRLYTLIDFVANQGASTITCDVQGYETVGDGTGTLITDPPTVLAHILHNWIYGDYRSGAWLTNTAPVDAASFAAATAFYSARGYEASGYFATKRTGLSVVNDFLRSFEQKAYWSTDGKIALFVEDFTAWSYVTDLVLPEDSIDGWQLAYPTTDLVDEVEARYAQTPTGGFTQTLSVKDLGTGEDALEPLELPNSGAAFL